MTREEILAKYRAAMEAAEDARLHGCWEAAAFHEQWAEALRKELGK
jgi:hypothetical protein